LSSPQQPQQQVQNDSDYRDVEELDQAEVADDIAKLLEELLDGFSHPSVPNKEAISAICA
jgi:hypothetical protein